MVTELEGLEGDITVLLPSKLAQGRYHAACRHMRALLAKVAPVRSGTLPR
jgi:hypothetical protein